MPLPSCQCIAGLTQAEKLDAIYCALLAISTGQGITVTVEQISNATDFGKQLLLLNALGDQFVVAGPAGDAALISGPQGAELILEGGTPFNGTQTPVGEIEVVNGVVVNVTA